MKLKQLVPMLNVSDVQASLAFYRDALGFDMVSPEEALDEWHWCIIRHGNVELMLSQTGAGPRLDTGVNPHKDANWPTILYFYPDDVTTLYQALQDADYQVSDLEVTFYGMNEFSMQDPDGHLLSFGQEQ